jgi:hypothetical protein
MSGLSNYIQTSLLNWVKGIPFPAAPTAIYVGLFNGDPTDAANSGVEVTNDIRTAGRVAVTFGAVTGNNTIANTTEVDFGLSAEDTDVTHFALYTTDVGGVMFGSAQLLQVEAIVTNDQVKFPVGSLTITLD